MSTASRIAESNKKWQTLRSSSTGSEGYYKASMFTGSHLLFTDGVREVCGENEAFWVIDTIASYFREINKTEGFVVARISKDVEGSGCLFTLDEGNDDGGYLVKQEIEYTDIPGNLKLYIQTDGNRWFIMMPEEY